MQRCDNCGEAWPSSHFERQNGRPSRYCYQCRESFIRHGGRWLSMDD